ncbi:MAG: DNA mismatch repair endonuclease MutL [Planctomycetota bacterium]
MPTIRQLPQSLVNKIAAGEVIERPASVVKELLENSVDAGATSIELAIEGGGIDLLRISDNGCGITPEQIPLALASHATSKLESADDLFDVHTLGFRGEALASIAEVSHLLLRTRTQGSDSGAEISVRGGEASEIQPTGCPVGTTIEVRHLFFNTPVRKKFLKTPQTEASHISEAFTRIALAYPHVQMMMTSGNRTTFDLPATDSWKERIRAFFGDEIADSLIAVESESDQAKLVGYVADPSVSRSNNRMQYLFLNGRHIKDRSLQHALGEAYRGLLMVGRFPLCFLRLDLPPSLVDVNVHPTKMEVRFQESGKLYSQLLRTLRHEFLTSDLTARARHVPGPAPAGLRQDDSSSGAGKQVTPQDEDRWQQHSDRMTEVAPKLNLTQNIPEFQPFPSERGLSAIAASPMAPAVGTAGQHTGPDADVDPTLASMEMETQGQADPQMANHDLVSPIAGGVAGEPATIQHFHDAPQAAGAQPAHSHLGFQVHQRYLITQDETGMVVIDQHALHERILYEQFRQKTESKTLEKQNLLVPEPLELTSQEAAAALEHKDLLAEIGIDIEPFGGDTVLMTAYPALLGKLRPAEVMRQVLEPLMAGGKEPSARDMVDELLHMFACKAAIKAGDKLASEEITALLEQRDHYQDTHHCPHGRPTALFFSREQLDKMFGRT